MNKHSYQQDLKSFNLNLSREPGNGLELTMFNHGELMSYSNYVGDLDATTPGIEVIDMEGNRRPLEAFKDYAQRFVLIDAIEGTRRYHFLCYPDIPADVMSSLYYYAEGHNSLQNRLPLWKIARSGVKSAKAVQVMCCFLDFGIVAPDLVLIDKARVERWEKLHDKVCALSGRKEGDFIYDGFSMNSDGVPDEIPAQAKDLLREEALSLRA